MAFLDSAHILWEARKPKIVLTDHKSVTRFFQTKAIPPALWNACEYVLQFNFKIARNAGPINAAADFLSRLELKVAEQIRLKIQKISQQHQSRRPPLPRIPRIKINFSARKQTLTTNQKNKRFNGKNNSNKL